MTKLLSFIFEQLAMKYVVNRLKRKAIVTYLRALQFARHSLLVAFIIFSFFQLMVVGFVGTLVTGIWLLPIENTQVRLLFMFGAFAFMFVIPIFLLVGFFSEKNWLKMSGVQHLVTAEVEQPTA